MSSRLQKVRSVAIGIAFQSAFMTAIGMLAGEPWTWAWHWVLAFTLYSVIDAVYVRWRAGDSRPAVALRARAEARRARRAARCASPRGSH